MFVSDDAAAVYIGAAIGWLIGLSLIAFVPPIRHFVVWSWTNPWLWASSLAIWGAYAVFGVTRS